MDVITKGVKMYKIRDTQFTDRYFAEGETFETLKEVCEQLISYHSVDCDMSVEQKLLDEGDIKGCLNELSFFEWDIEEVK